MRLKRVPLNIAFDASVCITAEQAQWLYRNGYRTAIRYVDRVISDPDKDDSWPYNLTISERDVLLDAGLCISLCQYFSTRYDSTVNGKSFSYDHGYERGRRAAINAHALGAIDGMAIWYDLESCQEATATMTVDELNGWSKAIVTQSLAPSLYVGSGLGNGVDGDLLWSLPRFRAYWGAASIVPQIPNRGFTMRQSFPIKVRGLELDQNIPCLDHRDYYDGSKPRTNVSRFQVLAA